MARLIPLQDLTRDRNYNLGNEGIFDPTGQVAYAADNTRLGTVRGAMVDPDSGRLRYLMVDVGGWFSSKEVLVPVGLARVEDDGVYFDTLTKEQVRDMREYRSGDALEDDALVHDERVLRGTGGTTAPGGAGSTTLNYRDDDASDSLFKTPNRLRLLEERLVVDKERYVAGSVEIGKHVENREQQVNVNLTHDEVVIERRPVTNAEPVMGNVQLGADRETIRVDVEAERAHVQKQAFVTEEVEIREREVSETRTFNETVGREVLDVNQTGDVRVSGAGTTGAGAAGAGMGGAVRQQDTTTTGGMSTGGATGASRVTAVFDSQAQAESAINDLRRVGVTDAHLSVIGRHDQDGNAGANDGSDRAANAGKGLLAGAGVGALFGLAAAAIPGVGPFISAGVLASTLGAAGGGAAAGAIVGGAAGTLAGALSNAGYDREEAEYYGRAVEGGGVLVAVENTSGLSDAEIRDVLRRHGGRHFER